MRKINYLTISFVNAGLVFIYTSGIAWLGFNNQRIFGGQKDSFLDPLLVLLLFVVSASVTGLLVLGKPIHLYLNNFKKESLALLGATLAWLIFFLLFVVMVLLRQ